jgi:hypothetical protein
VEREALALEVQAGRRKLAQAEHPRQRLRWTQASIRLQPCMVLVSGINSAVCKQRCCVVVVSQAVPKVARLVVEMGRIKAAGAEALGKKVIPVA